jgi:hypothetical protein
VPAHSPQAISDPAEGRIMESVMQPIRQDHAEDSRLRFVFDDAVICLSLAADATLEDVARQWGEMAPQHPGSPVAIDVTLPVRPGGAGARFFRGGKGSFG